MKKKAQDGPFEMYTDANSKIDQYKRIKKFFIVALAIEIICFFMELEITIKTGFFFYGIFTALLGIIASLMLRIVFKCHLKIEELKN